MSVFRNIVGVAVAVGALVIAVASQAADRGSGEFSGAKFSCLQYTNGLGNSASNKAQTNLAQIWMLGYMAGYYKAESKLEMTDDNESKRIIDAMAARCHDSPASSIFVVTSQTLVNEVHKLPTTAGGDFSPVTYTCGQHVDARNGAAADANRADLAELWAFAFIQGFKNVGSPGMQIDGEFKPALIGAINKSCAANRDTSYMDLAGMVAEKVKLQ